MKRILTLIIFCFIAIIGYTQPIGNEWINYSQKYYKIKIVQNGVYRISYNAFISSGVQLSPDPRSFQIFGRGVELYIYVKGESDGSFDPGDYIEFYAEKNNGWLDSNLYKPGAQGNPEYSLFTDTATYYLTSNSLTNNHRMIVNNADTNYSVYNAATYFNKIVRQDYSDYYFNGKPYTGVVNNPEYTQGEGWFDSGFSRGWNITKSIPTPNGFLGGPNAEIKSMVISASDYANLTFDHHVQWQFANIDHDTIFKGYTMFPIQYSVPCSSLGISNTSFVFRSIDDLGDPNNPDNNTISFISVKYPHIYNLENSSTFHMYIPNSTWASKSYLEISNLNVQLNDTIRLYDITNHRRIVTKKVSSLIKALVPNGIGEKHCYITSDNYILPITTITPVSFNMSSYAMFTNYSNPSYSNSDYLIVTHPSLMASAGHYKDYRTSTGYIPLIANIEELYDQFSYGVRKSPLALRNFCRFAINNFDSIPKDLFIIGKSYKSGEVCNPECSFRHNAYYFENSFVPGFGNPPSDILFTNKILDTLYQPAIPTGRLAAKTDTDVEWYLNKVIQHEDSMHNNPKEWMKNVLHFGGGTSIWQQYQLGNYLNAYKTIIEDTLFGGHVQTFLKSSSDPIEYGLSVTLKNIINNGVSLMTFFGHAAGIGFDMSIDNPSEYTNNGRYPFLLANSCLAGDLFNTFPTSTEAFVIIANKGVIGYLASGTPQLEDVLDLYSKNFYKNISTINYGQPVGKCIQQTIKTIQTDTFIDDPSLKNACLEMTLHGDPAVVINAQPIPDYVITPDKVFFTPSEITSETDSFTVNVISTNIGRAIADSFLVEVVRTFPNNTTEQFLKNIKATYFRDTIVFKMPVDKVRGIGLNHLKIKLDSYDKIYELSESNNTIYNLQFLIKATDITPVYPYQYAIVPSTAVTLKASTGDPFAPARNYIFQIDTTDTFDSQWKQQIIINHIGGVVSWVPTLMATDSMVYYWRTSPDSVTNGSYNWRESSFQFITGKRGWGQAHFFQFKNDAYQFVSFNRPARRFDFVNNVLSISAQTIIWPYHNWNDQYYKVNGSTKTIWAPHLNDVTSGMIVAVFDSISGEERKYYANGGATYYAYEFETEDQPGRDLLKNFLIDSISNGEYVLAYTHQYPNIPAFDSTLKQAIKSFGGANVSTVVGNNPYVAFGKKGSYVGSEHVTNYLTSFATINDTIVTKWKQGYIRSELIGPATRWDSLHWRYHPLNGINTDTVTLSVIGIKLNGAEDTVINKMPYVNDSLDISLLTRIDAAVYPYMKMVAQMKDGAMHTAAQMNRWQVIYEGVPETALDPIIKYSFYKDTLQEGDSIKFYTATHNISEYNMDSLLIKYWIVDKNRNVHLLSYKKQRPHPAGDTLYTSISASTLGLPGLNSLWIEVNPDNNQLEQYHFNNLGEIFFFVNSDKINPILDVTFDGVHILNGDVVSAKPEIQIKLNDENKYIALDDTSDFRILLKTPSATTPTRIYFGSHEVEKYSMSFIPANLPANSCKIFYNPDYVEDGIYELDVFARDKSGNYSGEINYKISYEVINKSTITEVMNWPNPFSTATHFVFKLTGSVVPTYFKIQIMTITGKVVREINVDELGPIHIGRNITEYAWDGKDDYGDRLANGVYLYRVVTSINGEAIEKYATEADKYFSKGFGKMYLIH